MAIRTPRFKSFSLTLHTETWQYQPADLQCRCCTGSVPGGVLQYRVLDDGSASGRWPVLPLPVSGDSDISGGSESGSAYRSRLHLSAGPLAVSSITSCPLTGVLLCWHHSCVFASCRWPRLWVRSRRSRFCCSPGSSSASIPSPGTCSGCPTSLTSGGGAVSWRACGCIHTAGGAAALSERVCVFQVRVWRRHPVHLQPGSWWSSLRWRWGVSLPEVWGNPQGVGHAGRQTLPGLHCPHHLLFVSETYCLFCPPVQNQLWEVERGREEEEESQSKSPEAEEQLSSLSPLWLALKQHMKKRWHVRTPQAYRGRSHGLMEVLWDQELVFWILEVSPCHILTDFYFLE